MPTKKPKLELTWIGKEERPKLEPRILIEDPSKSYGDRSSPNILIHGDNLLALRALEQDFAGKIKCIYIDPPFNTGSAFDHYDDGLEHSTWLSLMADRFERLKGLLAKNGLLFVHLDDSELAYAKVLLDEVMGRQNYCNTISMTTNDPSGFKATAATIFSTSNYILVYAKDKLTKPILKSFVEKQYDSSYSKILLNRLEAYSMWQWANLSDVVASKLGFENARAARRELQEVFDDEIARFAIANAENVFQTAAIGGGAAIKRADTIQKSIKTRDKIFVHPEEDVEGFYILNGRQILFYSDRLIEIDGRKVPAEIITDVWTDISWNGISNEGSVEFKNGKKPELLIKRILDMASVQNDWILDSFLGSGTTSAVAHKMGRRWIGIELGEHCHTHCIPRLQKVVDGTDQGGISKSVDWKGGGGFKYYYLAPSLLNQDKYGNWVISKEYNAQMLAAAMAKHEGFRYSPDEQVYWKQGRSTEKDFIYTTTQFVTVEALDRIHGEMQPGESLLVCCRAFSSPCGSRFPNITVKKIPNMLLGRCEFGREDYSLNIVTLPPEEGQEPFIPSGPEAPKPAKKKRDARQKGMFGKDGADE